MSFAILRVLMAAAVAVALHGQVPGVCSCGADPPGPPRTARSAPTPNTPEDMRPYGKFAALTTSSTRKQESTTAAAALMCPRSSPRTWTEVRHWLPGTDREPPPTRRSAA